MSIVPVSCSKESDIRNIQDTSTNTQGEKKNPKGENGFYRRIGRSEIESEIAPDLPERMP
jgi:hypothetical protein